MSKTIGFFLIKRWKSRNYSFSRKINL